MRIRTSMGKLPSIALALCGTLVSAQQLPPNPSSIPSAKTYDLTREIHLDGVVTRVEWVNPRAFLFVDTTDANGTHTNWAVEIGNPLDMERSGWNRNSLQVGDAVSVEGVPARGQTRQAFGMSVEHDGDALFVLAPESAPPTNVPTPRWPDGQIRLGPAPGEKGYWGRASVSAIVEDTGAELAANPIAMDKDGLLEDLSDMDRIAPFQPWAKSLFEYRQRDLLQDDPIDRCLPPGGPRQFLTPHGIQFIEQRELGRILVLQGGGNRNWRVIFTDGREQGQADEVVLSYFGNSVGQWEGDTLVVDSIGFNERFWISPGGLPHTEALHLVERFSRPDRNTLQYEVTIDDPRTYSRQWTARWNLHWVDGEEIQEFFCEENAEATFER